MCAGQRDSCDDSYDDFCDDSCDDSCGIYIQRGERVIAIIDYKAGNAPSVRLAAEKLGYDAKLVRDAKSLEDATHIILPGVGSAGATMDSLAEMKIINALEDAVLHRKVFFLGICVGLQVLFEHSAEDDAACLGWLEGKVIKFNASKVRVPQMGWNQVNFRNKTPGVLAEDDYFYFVNSYHAQPKNEADIWGVASYDGHFVAAVHRKNIYGTQFHAEKSGEAGLELLGGFFALGKAAKVC